MEILLLLECIFCKFYSDEHVVASICYRTLHTFFPVFQARHFSAGPFPILHKLYYSLTRFILSVKPGSPNAALMKFKNTRLHNNLKVHSTKTPFWSSFGGTRGRYTRKNMLFTWVKTFKEAWDILVGTIVVNQISGCSPFGPEQDD